MVWGSETIGLISTGCRVLHVVHKHEETGGKASQDSSLEVVNGAEVVLNWQFCIVLHYFALGWKRVRENCSCFGAEFCNMLQYAAMIGSSMAW